MDRKKRYMDNEEDKNGFSENMLSKEDAVLYGKISDFMKGKADTDDVMIDPDYDAAIIETKKVVEDFGKKSASTGNTQFVSSIFASNADDIMTEEIGVIEKEKRKNRLDELTAHWVSVWNKQKQENVFDPGKEEIRTFITDALDHENEDNTSYVKEVNRKMITHRSLLPVYLTLAAAALIGAFFVVRTLLPADNTDNLFASYYAPVEAISEVTRSNAKNLSESYSVALKNYISGNYQAAVTGFSESVFKDPSFIPAIFFLGVSQIELKNFDKAIDLLSKVAGSNGEYNKEAVWYLGLIYLKTGNKSKAEECFRKLAGSPGFYSGRSEKILRRLR